MLQVDVRNVGFIAGSFGSAYNTNGPFIVIYGTIHKWSPEKFRATLQGYFLPTGLLIVISHGFGCLWNHQVFKLYLMTLPVVFTEKLWFKASPFKGIIKKNFHY